MRYAVIADVHGNLPALEAVIADVGQYDVDGYLVLGDLVGYGPFPNECVRVVEGLPASAVAGNHDLIVLGALSDRECIRLARRTLSWTSSVLDEHCRDVLRALPVRAVAEGGVAIAHGSLSDPREYITTPAQVTANLARLQTDHPGTTILLVGHTHRPWACTAKGMTLEPATDGIVAFGPGPVLLNPGAVGQVRGGPVVARYLLLDTDARVATFRAVGYDVGRTRRELRRRGLPAGTYRLRRSALRFVRRLGGLTVRGVRRVRRR